MKAIIYARQSSGDNDTSESVELQIEKCQELALKEKIDIVGIFKDLNISGKTYPEGAEDIANIDIAFQKWYKTQSSNKKFRYGLGEVIKKLDEIDFILVYDITRLYRPVSGSHLESYINQLLIYNKVKVKTLAGVVDVGSFTDSLITALMNRINDQQIALARKKSMEAQKRLRDAGTFVHGFKHFGFIHKGKYEVEIDPIKAEVVRRIFEDVANYIPQRTILRNINAKYKHLWNKCLHPSSLRNMIRNPIYIGYMRDSSGELIKCKQVTGKEIISYDLWKKVQDIIEKRKCSPNKAKFRWLPYSSMLIDGKNGSKLVLFNVKHHLMYKTSIQIIDKSVECAKAVYIDVEKDKWIGLNKAMTPILILAFLQRINKAEESKENKLNIEKYEIELNNLKKREADILDKFNDGLIDLDIFNNVLKKNKKRKEEINKMIIDLKCSSEVNNFEEILLHQYVGFNKIINDELSNNQYEILLKETVNKIVVFDEKIDIYTNFGIIPLPRFISKNHYHFPKYYINLSNVDDDRYNRFDLRRTKITISYLMPSYYERRCDEEKTLFCYKNFYVKTRGE